MPRRLNAWAREVHIFCTQQTVALGKPFGMTVTEAVDRFGQPPKGSNAPRRLLEHAATKGFFTSVKEQHVTGARGCWFRARYFAVGATPDPIPQPRPVKRRGQSYFDGVQRAVSIFDLAKQCSSETTK